MIDIAAARGASVPIIAVDFGYSETPVVQLRPDRIVSSFADLPDAAFGLVRLLKAGIAETR